MPERVTIAFPLAGRRFFIAGAARYWKPFFALSIPQFVVYMIGLACTVRTDDVEFADRNLV